MKGVIGALATGSLGFIDRLELMNLPPPMPRGIADRNECYLIHVGAADEWPGRTLAAPGTPPPDEG